MAAKVLLLIVAFAGFSTFVRGQEVESIPLSGMPFPESIKHEIVRRILTFKFRPSNRQRVVYLANQGVEKSWLPSIQNVEFRLLSDEEVEDRAEDVYFFTNPELEGNSYGIGLAFGDPSCNYGGEGWRFRIVAERLRLWYAGGIGGGCGGGREFRTFGKLNTYPNELKGYEFFNKGKLQGLKLSISTREDVKDRFGTVCAPTCEYDRDWDVGFIYFGDFHIEMDVDGRRFKMVPKDEYRDKIHTITLSSKKTRSFGKMVFPRQFSEGQVSIAAHNGMGGGTNSTYVVHTDRYGLEYSVLEAIDLTTIKNLKWRKGDLSTIRYTIPEQLEEAMFRRED